MLWDSSNGIPTQGRGGGSCVLKQPFLEAWSLSFCPMDTVLGTCLQHLLHPWTGFRGKEAGRCLPYLFFFFFLELHLRHMQVPRLGLELELQLLAYITATAVSDLSLICDLHHSLWQCQILNPLSKAGIRPHSRGQYVGFLTCWVIMGSPNLYCFNQTFWKSTLLWVKVTLLHFSVAYVWLVSSGAFSNKEHRDGSWIWVGRDGD